MEAQYVGFGSFVILSFSGAIALGVKMEWDAKPFLMAVVIGVFIGIFASAGCSNFTYGSGQRTGTVVKLSKSGLIWKTVEGELMIGQTKDSTWSFTVPSNLERKVRELMDLRQEVVVEYDERGMAVPWAGRTRYHVTAIKPVSGPEGR